jgi:hypothetical protein
MKGDQPMRTQDSPQHQDRLQAVSDAFAEWRRSREKRCPIPESLWRAAVTLSSFYSTYRIAKVLRLDYAKLKRLIAESTVPDSGLRFVELRAESLFAPGQFSIQLHSPAGFHMEIRAEAAAPTQVLPLITAFLSVSR